MLAVKIDTASSWCRPFHYLTTFRQLDAGAVLILSAPGFFHRLQAALETECFFKANLLDISSIIFNPYLVLTPAMCGAEPQAEHPSERSERHDGFVSTCFKC